MQLETICAISVGDLLLESLGQVNDLNSLIWTPFNAHTTTNTKHFRNKTNFTILCDLNANLTSLVYWTGLGAFKITLFRLASIRIDNGNS